MENPSAISSCRTVSIQLTETETCRLNASLRCQIMGAGHMFNDEEALLVFTVAGEWSDALQALLKLPNV